MEWVGAATIIVGLGAVIVGLVLGARRTIQEPHLQSGWEESAMKLLGEILKAPRDKAFFVGGLLLVVLGVMLLVLG